MQRATHANDPAIADRAPRAFPTPMAGPRRRGFTIVELMTTIAIIFILVSFLMPWFYKARIRAKYVAWQGLSHNFHIDTNVVAYYDFEGATKEDTILKNKALGLDTVSSREDVVQSDFDAEMLDDPNNPEWVFKKARWEHKGGMWFDGNDYLRVKAPKFDFEGGTVFAWVRTIPESVGGIFSSGTSTDPNDEYFALRKIVEDDAGAIIPYWEGAISDGLLVSDPPPDDPTPNEVKAHNGDRYLKDRWGWHMIVMTWEPGNNMKIYFDGELKEEKPLGGEKQINPHENGVPEATNWTIGAEGDLVPLALPVNGLTGNIDEIGVLRVPMPPEQVKGFYKGGKPN